MLEDRRLVLTLRGRALLVFGATSLLAAWITGNRELALAASLLCAPVGIDLVFKLGTLSSLHVHLGARRTEAGRTFSQIVEVSNRSARRTDHDIVVHEPATANYRGRSMIERLGPGEKVQVPLLGRSKQRSVVSERELVIETPYPFGFFRCRLRYRVSAELVTEPARIRLPVRVLPTVSGGEPEFRSNDLLGGASFYSLREHQLDEDARMVHALKSATTGTLVRKVLRGQLPRELGVVLDLRRPPGRPLTANKRFFEYCLSVAASLADVLYARGHQQYWVVLGVGERGTQRISTNHDRLDYLRDLSTVGPVEWGPFDRGAVESLRNCEGVYWIPAGGQVRNVDDLDFRAVVLGTNLEGASP